MNLFRKMMGGKAQEDAPQPSLADEIREMAMREDAAAREDDRSGLVAIYPELGASRRKKRGFADLDFDDYVPELDDYEPGAEGEFLPADDHAHRAAPPAHRAEPQPAFAPPPLQEFAPPQHAFAPPPVAPMVPPPAYLADPRPRMAEEPPMAVARDSFVAREPAPQPEVADDIPALVQVPGAAGAARPAARRAGRVKTRLLGFDSSLGMGTDPFESGQAAPTAAVVRFPVGWIVVMGGPGRGASFTLFNGVSAIGRGDDQPVKLDFGDNSISRTNHAVVAYDDEQRKFFLGHGGKANIVRLNGKPVLSTEELAHNDIIRIGETTLRFLALCGPDFDWADGEGTQGGDEVRE
jgi:hypothetical protein